MAAFFALRGAVGVDDYARQCDGSDPSGEAHLLLDLRKPVAPGTASAALRHVGQRIAAGTPLKVYAVGDNPRTPRISIGSLCRPYADDALHVAAAKDGATTRRDCDDLPAQISPELRAAATTYCAQQSALVRRVDLLEAAVEQRVVDAYLVEAIEESVRELAAGPAPLELIVHSDMLQHAQSYSHLDLDWPEWGFDDYLSVLDAGAPARPGHMPPGLDVRLLYVARTGLTDDRRAQAAHWAFWRRYFDGADLAFERQPPQAGYRATPRMDLASALTEVVGERAAVARRRQEAARELRTINAEIEALEAGKRALVAAHDDLVERVDGLGRQRVAVQAERLRLQAEFDGRRSVAAEPVVPSTACALSLRSPFHAVLAEERHVSEATVNHGEGRMVVRYAVDAQGATLDGAVIDHESSTAGRPEYFDVLADDALGVVRGWRFQVDCEPGGAIGPDGQNGTATFIYRQKCVGAPIPRCRTVFSQAVP